MEKVGEDPPEKARQRRYVREDSCRKRFNEEDPIEKACRRRWLPEKKAHSRTNHGSDIM